MRVLRLQPRTDHYQHAANIQGDLLQLCGELGYRASVLESSRLKALSYFVGTSLDSLGSGNALRTGSRHQSRNFLGISFRV